jgi:hypothetical protein
MHCTSDIFNQTLFERRYNKADGKNQVMDALILDTTGEDFGKHAYSQMAEFNADVDTREVKLVDVPGVISRSEGESQEVFRRRARREAGEAAERLVEKIR